MNLEENYRILDFWEMNTNKKDIYVYAHWLGMPEAKPIGVLSAHQGKGRKSFSFEYDKGWLQSKEQYLIDPDIGWYSGQQFPAKKDNFGVFGVEVIESDKESDEISKWLAILMAPGSSLGGARPKANILDDNYHPWISISQCMLAITFNSRKTKCSKYWMKSFYQSAAGKQQQKALEYQRLNKK